MRVTLLGFTVPPRLLHEINATDRLMQTQTHRFAWGLVEGLRLNDVHVDLLSTAPVSDYPRNRRIAWPGGRFTVNHVEGRLLPFVNVTGLKHVTRYLACWFIGFRDLRRTRPDWLLVHGVHSPFLWFAASVRRFLEVRVAIVLTDPPGVIRPEDGVVKSLLKRIDIRVVRRALSRTDAVIVLAQPLASDFAPEVPYLVVEGLSNTDDAGARLSCRSPDAVVVFAGGLHDEYGVKNLVNAFRSLPDPLLRLELYGRGPLEPWLAEQVEADPRIAPVRLVPPEDLPAIYSQATVLVQPRQIDQHFVRYSFPSKLIEYMASGTAVISTRLPTIPSDYEPFVVWTEGDAPNDLALAMSEVLAWSPQRRAAFGADAARFVCETRGTHGQGERIVRFLESLDS